MSELRTLGREPEVQEGPASSDTDRKAVSEWLSRLALATPAYPTVVVALSGCALGPHTVRDWERAK